MLERIPSARLDLRWLQEDYTGPARSGGYVEPRVEVLESQHKGQRSLRDFFTCPGEHRMGAPYGSTLWEPGSLIPASPMVVYTFGSHSAGRPRSSHTEMSAKR